MTETVFFSRSNVEPLMLHKLLDRLLNFIPSGVVQQVRPVGRRRAAAGGAQRLRRSSNQAASAL